MKNCITINRVFWLLAFFWGAFAFANERLTLIQSDANKESSNLSSKTPKSLTQTLLLHEFLVEDHHWYTGPQIQYANYVSDSYALAKDGYPPERASQWLYDRPQALYQLYIITGDSAWLYAANNAVNFYIKHINSDGYFDLKKRFDPKYLMPKGLQYAYILTGNEQAKNALARMYKKSFEWNPNYNLKRGFWTERNQAAALNVALSYWEVTRDTSALERVHDIIDATYAMTFTPVNGWPIRNCPQHSYKAHEGKGVDKPVCSPWMMALLGDNLWRFYRITGDEKSAELITAFSEFVLNDGIYYGDDRVKNMLIPKYLTSMEAPELEELNQWTDPQHSCDVAALIGKGAYIQSKQGKDSFMLETLFDAVLGQCKQLITPKPHNKNKVALRVKPPRRFAWTYSSTSDLPWLVEHFSR